MKILPCARRPPSLELPIRKQPRLQQSGACASTSDDLSDIGSIDDPCADPELTSCSPHVHDEQQHQDHQQQQDKDEGAEVSASNPGTYWQDPVSPLAFARTCLTAVAVPSTLQQSCGCAA